MKTVGICVGHSRSNDTGADSVDGTSEWDYNEVVAELTARILSSAGVKVELFDLYEGDDYHSAMSWLAQRLNDKACDCAIELHFNSADSPAAEGFEYIYWHTSNRGQHLADCLLQAHHEMAPVQKVRGTKPASFNNRGSAFLRKPKCPCCICEPFFGSSVREWQMFSTEEAQGMLALIYAKGLASYLEVELPMPYVEFTTHSDKSPADSEIIAAHLSKIDNAVRDIRNLLP